MKINISCRNLKTNLLEVEVKQLLIGLIEDVCIETGLEVTDH